MSDHQNRLLRPRKYRENKDRVPVVARIKGWNDTHVIFDVYIGNKLRTENLARPIERFMCEYGLNNPIPASAV